MLHCSVFPVSMHPPQNTGSPTFLAHVTPRLSTSSNPTPPVTPGTLRYPARVTANKHCEEESPSPTMPSLHLKSNRSKDNTDNTGPPPAYSEAADVDVDNTAAFSTLSLHDTPKDPDADTCLAHSKLLFALQSLKEDVGYTDGLWDIWDSRQDTLDPAAHRLPDADTATTPDAGTKIKLSAIREKRWALYVARAVDRYEAWWSTFDTNFLREDDMKLASGALYHNFVSDKQYMTWDESMLPPLDVLMVWHAHMLNPRAFLEDTLRCGLSSFWASGMPWRLVSAAIDTDFNYNVSDATKAAWVAKTGRNWDNVEDGARKTLRCPSCQAQISPAWTTCGQDDNPKSVPGPSLIGKGYGDGEFLYKCDCGTQINKTLLSVAKFVKDVQSLIIDQSTMPGTILDPITGVPTNLYSGPYGPPDSRTFPNRLVKRLVVQIGDLIKPGGMESSPTMDDVREMIEQKLIKPDEIRKIEEIKFSGRYRLPVSAKICVRKMMSRYWENFSPFALDLVGAVMRQGIFTGKMHQIDWLHSPACRGTMARLVKKYDRFVTLMQVYPDKVCVPTLDIDLAWHTHQLSPSAYYKYTTKKTKKFIDHDDKIDEDKLSQSFEWTTMVYQDMYSEVYSECTCWYCETVRSSNTGSLSRFLGVSNQEKVSQNFHDSGRASLCPPDKSAHISAHNAVRNSAQETVSKFSRLRQHRQLELNYEKACKRAEKKGRKLPPREQYYDHWGYQYYMYSPFIYPMYFTPGLYPGWDPGFVSSGTGSWANCAMGSCSGVVAAGACGGPGGCGGAGVSLPPPCCCFLVYTRREILTGSLILRPADLEAAEEQVVSLTDLDPSIEAVLTRS